MLVILGLKFLSFFLRTFTKNSATAYPGLLLEKYFPATLQKLFLQLENTIFITGTNGKTTTSRMLGYLLDLNNIPYISNTSGSNMIRGFASSLIQGSTVLGKVRYRTAVFEVEEATMPKLVKFVKPQTIVITNIFRDQLDAYGEIDKTWRYIKSAIQESNNPNLILNGNDKRVCSLAQYSNGKINYISFNKKYLSQIKFENGEDIIDLEENSASTDYFKIDNIRYKEDLKIVFDLRSSDFEKKDIEIKVPGIFSAFNATAAFLGFAHLMKRDIRKISDSYRTDLSNFEAVFGRGEIIIVENKKSKKLENSEDKHSEKKSTKFQVFLVKNPAGMNLNLHLLENAEDRDAVLFILNDKIADGRDVSWIWDCDFTILKNLNFKDIYIAGERREDMALRIAYEIGPSTITKVFETLNQAITELSTGGSSKVYVLPTYTAMREFRSEIAKITKVKEIWRQ